MDSRLLFAEAPKWRTQISNQKLAGTELHAIQANTLSSTLYEFELPNNMVLLFGALSGFKISGRFEVSNKVTAEVPNPVWDKVPLADYANLVLQPNWFEHLVKAVDVFHNNTVLKAHDVPRYVDAFVNTYLYGNMDEDVKKCLCPEKLHPGNAVPSKKNGWDPVENSEFHTYSKGVFNKGSFTFRYVLPFTFPFFQQSNFCGHGRPPSALLMPLLGKVTVSLNMRETSDHIFKRKATNEKNYRFVITKVELMVEEARLNPAYEKSLLSAKKPLYYAGVTKFSITENIQAAVMSHRCRFQDIPYPEGLFIFALPKTVVGGQYKYSTIASYDDVGFQNHNIDSVDISFENKKLCLKTPNLVGNITDHMVEIKQWQDHVEYPPFGVLQNLHRLTLDVIKEGGHGQIFPHIYINLCASGRDTRILPIGTETGQVNRTGDLDIDIKFKEVGAADGVTYFLYAFYTDVSFMFDPKTKQFSPFYKRSCPNH